VNVKPGDLAIIVQCDIKEAIGVVVEVLSPAGCNAPGVFEWFVRPSRPLRCFDVFGLPTKGTLTEMGCPDAWLRPVSGLPIDEETRDEVAA
jgi:hypothetical protein